MSEQRPITPHEPDQCALIVLAAGASLRAGRPKALVRRPDGRALLDATLDALAQAPVAGPRLVVIGAWAAAIEALLAARPDSATWQRVGCEDWHEGMAASLRAGLAALPPGTGAVMVALGDMPHVEPGMLDALLACRQGDERRIVAPCHAQRRGHPVVWGAGLLAELAMVRGDEGGRHLIARHAGQLTLVPAGAGCVTDYDTPEALRSWETSATSDDAQAPATLQPRSDRPM
ncbi:CTP:molybdopterin cytidylyltransferase MocA [Endobacter medicaginis]|uniref:CTP:molybdopterin cytidylyltransferase MocA n=2 Tax=Endobacter medicaginis TaxID=1181271 RepID=A0A839UXL4_9PROT|nr:nucleotidyltransferase family protein [Endobacter medicaginis]MBB3175098.1 CTP:molybdopterin cytidylyltransferase MocA [Endobacter medicaginis]MCX5476413.1 nucleotidyltransferase family protein [Endobacter medicaginis]